MKTATKNLLLALALCFCVGEQTALARVPEPSLVLGRNAVWGAIAGAATGTVLWPVTGQLRTVAVGASVGLYMGLIYGAYLAFDPDYLERQQQELRVDLLGPQSERGVQAMGPTPPWITWTLRY